ncbi:hypothetical protein BRE01_65690 [Brevibacillus reuszeri]|uniref:Uncharacterized protein n=1 Tax=Brevibacillus reuszeri TaxID=54915 RepID=A0ABQ0TZY4_9BACL|nr:hypothetical protein BRE01_65690 [Brevibacillus reuszeri]
MVKNTPTYVSEVRISFLIFSILSIDDGITVLTFTALAIGNVVRNYRSAAEESLN